MPYLCGLWRFANAYYKRSMQGEVNNSVSIDNNLVNINPNIDVDSTGKVTISWKAIDGALGYKVYYSDAGSNNRILLCDLSNNLSVTDNLQPGQTRYYYIETVYQDSSITKIKSTTYNSNNANISIVSKKMKKYSMENIEYASNSFNGNNTLNISFFNNEYYTLVSKKGKNKILVEEINVNSGKRKTKKITVGKYDVLGGAFKLDDGNIYVAIGNNNKKESTTKNVISVIKYGSNWKKLGECKIKGNAENEFPGIVGPFDAGNVDMSYSD